MNTRTAIGAGAAVMLVVLLSPQILLARPLESKRMERAKSELRNGNGVAQAVYGAGYGSGSRLYERADRMLGSLG